MTPAELDALGIPRKRIVVGFAGGGGACFGIRAAYGVDPDAALNHWHVAIDAHRRHFPNTGHYLGDIIEVSPKLVCPGEPVGFAWFSPDCTDHSKAKGKAPKSERIRGLAWCILPWVAQRRPDVLMLENVEEWFDWGPVYRTPAAGRVAGRLARRPADALRAARPARAVAPDGLAGGAHPGPAGRPGRPDRAVAGHRGRRQGAAGDLGAPPAGGRGPRDRRPSHRRRAALPAVASRTPCRGR